MSAYNLTKPDGREALRADRQSELDAVERGEWPRDLNDIMRWSPPRFEDPAAWAAKMCRADLHYLSHITDSDRVKGRS
jgi:hypothetical protein